MSTFKHLGTGYHLQFALACSRFLSGMAREALLRVHVLPLLLFWDFYQCPRTLALASACLRYGTLTHLLVHSLWGYLCFHSMTPHNLLVLEEASTVAARSCLKSLPLLYSLWLFLIIYFSCLSILDQAGKSVPNLSRTWRRLALASQYIHWSYSSCVRHLRRALGCKQADQARTRLHHCGQPVHELFFPRCRRCLLGCEMLRRLGSSLGPMQIKCSIVWGYVSASMASRGSEGLGGEWYLLAEEVNPLCINLCKHSVAEATKCLA